MKLQVYQFNQYPCKVLKYLLDFCLRTSCNHSQEDLFLSIYNMTIVFTPTFQWIKDFDKKSRDLCNFVGVLRHNST